MALGEVTQPLPARGAGKPASGVSVLRRKQRSAPGIGSDSGMGSLSVDTEDLRPHREGHVLYLALYVDTIM